MNDLAEFRRRKDDFFRRSPQSPLTPEQQRAFRGLVYFDEDEGLRFDLPQAKPLAHPVHHRQQGLGVSVVSRPVFRAHWPAFPGEHHAGPLHALLLPSPQGCGAGPGGLPVGDGPLI